VKSIMQSEKACYISGRTDNLEDHHIFGGANRKNSERYGLKVWLNHNWHNEPPDGAHHNAETMDYLHREGQMAFERVHGSREDFMRIFGKNFL
jgi:hypothetical protein